MAYRSSPLRATAPRSNFAQRADAVMVFDQIDGAPHANAATAAVTAATDEVSVPSVDPPIAFRGYPHRFQGRLASPPPRLCHRVSTVSRIGNAREAHCASADDGRVEIAHAELGFIALPQLCTEA